MIFRIDDSRKVNRCLARQSRDWEEETNCRDGRDPESFMLAESYGGPIKNRSLRVGHLGIWLMVLNGVELVVD